MYTSYIVPRRCQIRVVAVDLLSTARARRLGALLLALGDFCFPPLRRFVTFIRAVRPQALGTLTSPMATVCAARVIELPTNGLSIVVGTVRIPEVPRMPAAFALVVPFVRPRPLILLLLLESMGKRLVSPG